MSFKKYLREAEKKGTKKKKVVKKEVEVKVVDLNTSGKDGVPGSMTGNVMGVQQPPIDNLQLSTEAQGNLEAYNIMRAFGMSMENNLPSVVVLKSHPTPEIAQGAVLLEKDIRAIIEFIMNMQIPLN